MSEHDEEQDPKLPVAVLELRKEQSDEGKFRKLPRGTLCRIIVEQCDQREELKGRFEHINPCITAPSRKFPVMLGSPSVPEKAVLFANHYNRIVWSESGHYVEIPPRYPDFLAVRPETLTKEPSGGLTVEHKWIGFKYLKHNVYFSGYSLDPKVLPPPAPKKKCGGPRKHAEFSQRMFYVPVMDSFSPQSAPLPPQPPLTHKRPHSP